MEDFNNYALVEELEDVDLVDGAFLYSTQSRYPKRCSDARKRAIRKKAEMFVIRDGVMFFKKKKKDKVIMKESLLLTYYINYIDSWASIYEN